MGGEEDLEEEEAEEEEAVVGGVYWNRELGEGFPRPMFILSIVRSR